ncbi:universal stress protein [Nocardia terpenica]|uniref:Universal stress protein UspA n=1 Tax=Nocardia terpenica TaxID=455432 RepID=A0A161Y354_9NOCA|nr:universal stress protein [Nocardia terpenica]KZM69693.1 universal stress protein UspA [Nocardia terpenica]MBF6062863.1 universal stress protein [Nocardia terpenica]MBF6105002.1 universal stress protein [Nocardia terpenica]MBF6112561.1 universal stress protein [Nocardia terpenica]MBF6118730.1 universal stress protein [Nocardia terpenica]
MPCDLMLIAYDGSENAKRAVEYAGRFLSATRAVVLTAWEPMVRQAARLSGMSGVMQPEWLPDEELEDIAFVDAKQINAEGVRLAKLSGLNAEARTAECTSTIWNAIVDVADELDVDIIVAGTRGATGIRALMHSSVAEAVLKHCHRPILLVPPGKHPDGTR